MAGISLFRRTAPAAVQHFRGTAQQLPRDGKDIAEHGQAIDDDIAASASMRNHRGLHAKKTRPKPGFPREIEARLATSRRTEPEGIRLQCAMCMPPGTIKPRRLKNQPYRAP